MKENFKGQPITMGIPIRTQLIRLHPRPPLPYKASAAHRSFQSLVINCNKNIRTGESVNQQKIRENGREFQGV